MSPTSSSRLFAGRNARSATLRDHAPDLSSANPSATPAPRTPAPSSLCDAHGPCQHGNRVLAHRLPTRHVPPVTTAGLRGRFARGGEPGDPRGGRVPSRRSRALVAGCGGGERQDADEPSGTYKVDVVERVVPDQASARASPRRCAIARAQRRHAGRSPTSRGHRRRRSTAAASDRRQPASPTPTARVDRRPGPRGRRHRLREHLGARAACPPAATRTSSGASRRWRPAAHLRYRVAAGPGRQGQAQLAGGGVPAGHVHASASPSKPAQATVDPATGDGRAAP